MRANLHIPTSKLLGYASDGMQLYSDVAQVARRQFSHSANSQQMAAECRRPFSAATIVVSFNAAQLKLQPVPVRCHYLRYSESSTETRFRRDAQRIAGGIETEKLSKSLKETNLAQTTLSVSGVSCAVGYELKGCHGNHRLRA